MPPQSSSQTRRASAPGDGGPGTSPATETLDSGTGSDHPSTTHSPPPSSKGGSNSSRSISSNNRSNSSSTLSPPTRPAPVLLLVLRSACLLSALLVYLLAEVLQGWVDVSWQYLRSAWWFQSVYFETVWATVSYGYLIPLYPFALHFMPCMDRYKVDRATSYMHQTVQSIAWDAVVYMAPLALLDTLMVKKYSGVDPQEWVRYRQYCIQTTRALPPDPPTVMQLCYQVIGGVVIFDALFFVLHLALHKQRTLYRWLHARHHEHGVMHAHITNQLSVGERIMLILAANQALKFLYSHPLSRAVFVPVFIFFLIDNHSGYDLPWGLQHLLPRGLWGGPRLHHAHHMMGSRHYQPFLTYLDHALTWWEGRQREAPPRQKTDC